MKYERLTEKDTNIIINCLNCSRYESECSPKDCIDEAFNRLAELEDKIEAGTLVKLPCKVGDIVYYIWLNESVSSSTIEVIKIRENTITFDTASGITYLLEHLGQTVFLTKEEAEAKLKEVRGEV